MKRGGKQSAEQSWHTHLKWLRPGLGVKRWLLLLGLGVGLLSLGGAVVLREFYPLSMHFYYLTLQFVPRQIRAILLIVAGISSLGIGLWGLNRAMLEPFIENAQNSIPEVLYDYRRRGRGPKIVVIGGGHGQATVLRGLKQYTTNITAIVTVADDGGSSGRLRRELGILPPGDFRNCLAALADDESLVTRLFQYRFASGKDLGGHSFGNLFISAMSSITGSFETGLEESSRVLAVEGRVLPSTLATVTLCADVAQNGAPAARICGESEIPQPSGRIQRVFLDPPDPRAYPLTVQAILEADLVVIGPGSLYTSIMPNLLVGEIAEALRTIKVPRVYICNVATQVGETEEYTAADHLQAIEEHLGRGIVSVAVINTYIPTRELPPDVAWVRPDLRSRDDMRVVSTNLVDETLGWRHKSDQLAQIILNILKQSDWE
ncbi:MAG: YvcK family protein [Anaerolineae bacterium]|nr:YvcK family protein [Anaerolineae bacterium]